MRKSNWKSWLLSAVGCGVLFQAPTCTDAFQVVTSVSSIVTAGGVIYLVSRVLE